MATRLFSFKVSLLGLLATALALSISVADTSVPEPNLPNANHIFNAIHSSMRQWGSSLHHNGMSFFLASVPAGTQLYHGNADPDPVNGTEWLAFEPEHAMVFAQPFRGPPHHQDKDRRRGRQEPLRGGPASAAKETLDVAGWLHTYTAKKDLRLLYVDGMSAGKTENGTLDSQNRILFRDEVGNGGPIMGEWERARLACRMAREVWHDRLDGLLRMEAGFEVILCDFARDLDITRVTRVKGSKPSGGRGPGNGKGGPGGPDGPQLWFKAIAARYHGIGGNRVMINYDSFVTAFSYGLGLFRPSEATGDLLPRLTHLSSQELEPIRQDLDHLILNHDAKEATFNWQSITDIIVERYARDLRFFASGQLTLARLHSEIENTMGPFIDYGDRNTSREADRCAAQFIPAGAPPEGTAAAAVQSVAARICTTLVEVCNLNDLDAAVTQFQNLTSWLAWTTWKECRGCADHELCVVPIWPMGTVDDYKHPQCRDASVPYGDGPAYWGRQRHGGPPKPAPSPPSWLQSIGESLSLQALLSF